MRTSATGIPKTCLPLAQRWGGGPPAGWWRGSLRRPVPSTPPPRYAGSPSPSSMGRQGGFTLIELLVVLVIIGLVSAAVVIGMPDPRGALRGEALRLAA